MTAGALLPLVTTLRSGAAGAVRWQQLRYTRQPVHGSSAWFHTSLEELVYSRLSNPITPTGWQDEAPAQEA